MNTDIMMGEHDNDSEMQNAARLFDTHHFQQYSPYQNRRFITDLNSKQLPVLYMRSTILGFIMICLLKQKNLIGFDW